MTRVKVIVTNECNLTEEFSNVLLMNLLWSVPHLKISSLDITVYFHSWLIYCKKVPSKRHKVSVDIIARWNYRAPLNSLMSEFHL